MSGADEFGVYDETLDAERTGWGFWTRVLVLALFMTAAAVALFPSVTGFAAGPNADRTCVAAVDAWHKGPPKPSDAEVRAIEKAAPSIPSPEALNDPAARARIRRQAAAFRARPDVQQMSAYADWTIGAGACVPESRHRLIITGWLLGVVLAIAIATATTVTIRRREAHN